MRTVALLGKRETYSKPIAIIMSLIHFKLINIPSNKNIRIVSKCSEFIIEPMLPSLEVNIMFTILIVLFTPIHRLTY